MSYFSFFLEINCDVRKDFPHELLEMRSVMRVQGSGEKSST